MGRCLDEFESFQHSANDDIMRHDNEIHDVLYASRFEAHRQKALADEITAVFRTRQKDYLIARSAPQYPFSL